MKTALDDELIDHAEDQANIAALAALQQQLGETDARFAKRWLNVHATSWLRLREGTYGAEDWAPMMARVHRAIHSIEQYLETATLHGGLLRLSHVGHVLTGVKTAMRQNRDRLVLMLAPTGGGKSSVVPLLQMEYPEQVAACEATEPWRESYLAACSGLAETLKIETSQSSARVAEKAVIEELSERPRKLVIDEAHYLGRPTLNFVKAVLNKTSCVVVLLAIPRLWKQLTLRSEDEVSQLRARTCARITIHDMPREDLALFLGSRVLRWEEMPADERAASAREVKTAGEALGLWDTAAQIVTLVNGSVGAGVPTAAAFRQAAADVRAIR